MSIDYKSLIKNIIKPLINNEVQIKEINNKETKLILIIMNQEDYKFLQTNNEILKAIIDVVNIGGTKEKIQIELKFKSNF